MYLKICRSYYIYGENFFVNDLIIKGEGSKAQISIVRETLELKF